MAIVVDQDKKVSSAPSFLGLILVVAVILVAGYYIFFAPPPSVVVTPPQNYAAIAPIANINFNPSSVTSSTSFQALRSTIAEPTSTGPVAVGRQNPFVTP